MKTAKPWYESKQLWIGVLEVSGGVATALAGELALGGALTLSGVLKVILRVVTNRPVTFK